MRLFYKADFGPIENELVNIIWDFLFMNCSVDAVASKIRSVIEECIVRYVQLVEVDNAPRLNRTLKYLRRKTKIVYKKHSSCRSDLVLKLNYSSALRTIQEGH